MEENGGGRIPYEFLDAREESFGRGIEGYVKGMAASLQYSNLARMSESSSLGK